ncbi:MAG: hypothetical protein ABEJ98_04615 [Candidatus Nanohaloarchaea archaeon]
MRSGNGKILILAAVLMLALVPAVADGHVNGTDRTDAPEDDSDIKKSEDGDTDGAETREANQTGDTVDGTDNRTELTVDRSEAEQAARNVLSDNNWTLEDSKTHEEDGYYEFKFVVKGKDAEAEVRVDGSSGEVFRHEEKLEDESDGVKKLEKVEVQSLEEARKRIKELRSMVMELRGKVAELEGRADSERGAEFERRGNETEAEVENKSGETKSEAEIERGSKGTEGEAERRGPPAGQEPSENARENVNGTPGSDQAQQRRPEFINKLLSSFFG